MITLFNLIYYVALTTMVSSIPLCKVALILCVYVCGCARYSVCTWKSEDSF